jgi:hypothetical protein
MQQWANQLPYQYTDEQRKDHLWSKVLKVVQDEALKYTGKPAMYDAFISHLQKIKDTIGSQNTARRAIKANQLDQTNAPQGNKDKQGDKDKPKMLPTREKPTPEGEKKDDSKPATKKFQKGITCFYCKREGHIESECYIKIADKAKKSADTPSESSTT